MEFRQDINGLRALAVAAVVLYHFGMPGFTGGFIGVDVFFVISGFLMTGIILTAMAENRFSIASFYWSRAKRIVPALTFLCATLLALGWFWLSPVDYAQLGKHAASAVIFVSNFVFKAEDGYFDTSSQDKFLLHTWSLSVEWQFYLIFPILLAMICHRRRSDGTLAVQRLAIVLTLIALVSFGFTVALTQSWEAFAFYLLPTRIWELLAGALVFLCSKRFLPNRTSSIVAHGVGLSLIGLAIFAFDTSTEWPGYAALAPVIGTGLLIWSPQKNDRIFSNKLSQNLGAWSYSIYLWHWPVHVVLRHARLHESLVWLGVGILLSVALGALSFLFVETPLRRSKLILKASPRLVVTVTAGFVLCVALAGHVVYRQKGVPGRVSASIQNIENVIHQGGRRTLIICGSAGKPTTDPTCKDIQPHYAVWGDSHAGVIYTAVQQASGAVRGILYTNRCPPLIGGYIDSKKLKGSCIKFTAETLDKIARLPREIPLVVAFRFSYYINGYIERQKKLIKLRYADIPDSTVEKNREGVFTDRLVETLCSATQAKRSVYVVQPVPEIGVAVPHTLSRQLMIYGEAQDITISLAEYEKRHRTVLNALQKARDHCGIKLLDPLPHLCKAGRCEGSINQRPLYFDDDHLSQEGVMRLVPMFQGVFGRSKVSESQQPTTLPQIN